jgi:sigma-E factor negative regulatory protein RseC
VNQEIVQVVETGNNGVWVEGIQQSACNSCSARAGCGQHSFSKLGKPVRLWVPTGDHFRVGEQVTIQLPSGSLAISALCLYGLPLIGLIIGAVIGYQGGSEPQSLLAGALGLVGGLLLARKLGQKMQGQWQPRVLKNAPVNTIKQGGLTD